MSQLKIKNGNIWESIPAGGIGVPSGGTTGQVLQKSSNTDYATEWAEPSSSGFDLLWTNPSPNASFAAQTISLDLSSYSHVMIEHHNSTLYFDDIFPVGKATRINYLTYASGNAFAHQRPTDITANGIIFDNANQNGSQNNSDIIPVRIWGIKT